MKNTTLLILLSFFIISCSKNGEYIEYYKNGQIVSKVNYKDGMVVDGIYTSYYKNGQIEEEKNYKNGILLGYIQ